MDLGLKGRVALVCASSRGLGRAAAEALASEGANLILCARGEPDLMSTAASIEATGVRVVPIVADLSDPNEVVRVVAEGRTALGPIEILVTNTGGPPAGPFESHDAEAWRRAVEQNLDSVVNLCRAVLPDMKAAGFGRIVNVTSIAVKQPVDGLILSNSVRAAVTGFAKTLANEVGPDQVVINNVCPGYTTTDRLGALAANIAARDGVAEDQVFKNWASTIPLRRLATPEEFANVVVFLASEQAAYVHGTTIAVDGGRSQSVT